MPKVYEYTAHAGNTIRRDTMEAESEKHVRAWLRDQGMFPLAIKVAPKPRVDLGAELKKALKPAASPARAKGAVELVRKKDFLYTAVPSSGGEEFKGEIQAVDERDVRQILRERSLFPIKVKVKPFYYDFLPSSSDIADSVEAEKSRKVFEATPMEELAERWLPRTLTQRQVPLKDFVFYVQQMSTMLEAGLAVSQTLDILGNSITNRRLARINHFVKTKIFEGVSLAEAFGEHKAFLPTIFVELVAIGEQSGNIEETTRRSADYLEATAETQRKIKGAMTYPLVLLGLISLIVTGLMIFVMPTFMQLFAEFKLKLPWTTRTLLGMSWYIQHRWYMLPLYPLVAYVSLKWFRGTNVGKSFADAMEYRWPLLGKLAYKVTTSRLLYNMALFLRCGVTITMTLESVRDNTANLLTAAKIEDIRLGIVQGARLGGLFEASGLFPPFVNHLITAGEEAGNTDEMMFKGAKYIDQEIEAAIKMLTAAIEPLMTVMIAGIILFILGSLYLPLIGMMSNTSKVAG